MATLNPAPATLGIASPALGPWFDADSSAVTLPTLQAPAANLSVTVTLNAGTHWLPPAGGLLGFYVSTSPRPPGLAQLRQASGEAAFADNRLVALFRLLPEVEQRLNNLLKTIPSADGGANSEAVRTRSRVRYFAIELPDNPPALSALENRIQPPFPSGLSDSEKAEYLGLKLDGGNLTNGEHAMSDLKRPGFFSGDSEKLLTFPADTTVSFWVFDDLGKPLDPGAVAGWWEFLAKTAFDNLWADGVETANQRTAPADAQLTVHLANAHEGAIGDTLLNRLSFSNMSGSGVVRTRGSGSGAASVSFTAAPSPDDAPVPKIAMLPNGTFADSVALWPSGAVDPLLARDFVRVAVVDVEEHLVGQKRTTTAASGTPAARRAADQNRVSTRVNVARSSAPALLGTTDEAADGIISVLTGTEPARLVTSVLSRDWAGLDALSLPTITLPDAFPALTVSALTGGGSASGDTVSKQRVLAEFTLDSSLAGAWVRIWPHGFNSDTGQHFRMDGGGGKVRADGAVSIVTGLPDGALSTDAPMTVDALIVGANGARFYPNLRFSRPAPVGGAEIAIGSVSGEIVICETGDTFAGGTLPDDSVPSGATLFARQSSAPALINRDSLPINVFTPDTVIRNLASGDIVGLTQPAFRSTPAGDSTSLLSVSGATVNQQTRAGLDRILEAGAPLPTMERLEIAAARIGSADAAAAIAGTPSLNRNHELLSHQTSHPGAPASVEIHGSGAFVTGPAAVGIAEYVRGRTAGNTGNLATAARTPFPAPADPSAPSLWVASLQTVAAAVETEPALIPLITDSGSPYPFGDTLDNIRSWLSSNGITIPAAAGAAANSIVRALDRRMLSAAFGSREGATSLLAAVKRAEDFIYLETPAFDDTTLGNSEDQLQLWQALKDRMTARPALRVLICLPVRHLPGIPAPLGRVRDALLIDALASLKGVANGEDRVAAFAPSAGPGRTLRLASTSVIVDDAYAFTGTTHLWRRGLSFDSSLSISLFDESLQEGRPAEIRQFRRRLISERLGMQDNLLPDDPAEIIDAVKQLFVRGGSSRLATDAVVSPDPAPTSTDRDIWNRDGSPQPGFDPIGWITALTAAIRAQLEEEVTPAP